MDTPRTPLNIRTVVASLYLHDVMTIAFLQVLSIVAIVFSWRLEGWMTVVVLNVLASAVILMIAILDHLTDSKFLAALHRYYIAVAIFATFKETYVLVPAVNPYLYDNVLIAIDHAMFGVNPTQWLQQFTSPPLVELLQNCYSSFYLIMLALAVEMNVRNREPEYEQYVSMIVLAFFLSYIGYMLVPAVGPRFTLHDFEALNRELPGMFFTDTLRSWINSGESISDHAANFLATAQRDAFPSGHTEMTLMTIALAWRFRAAIRWWVTIIGAGLIIGTVFLRYHYVIDLIGGTIFFLITLKTYPAVERWWQRRRDAQELS